MLSTRNPLSNIKWSEPCPKIEHFHQYFAYDSNLDPEQMKRQSPDAKFITRAILPNHSLRFDHFSKRWSSGVLDIVESPDEQVAGVLYQVPHDDIKNLDKSGDSYQRVKCQVYPVDEEGVVDSESPVEAELYETSDPSPEVPPTNAYLNALVEGAKYWQLPEEYINKIKDMAESIMLQKPRDKN